MAMIKFSVLISIYSKEKSQYLNECLNSLYKQTIPADEIIIVLDGPVPTELKYVIDEWKKQLPLKIVELTSNVGLGKALNEGLKYCQYDWVFRMDADDICLPERFEKQYEYIDNNPNIVLVGTQVTEFDTSMETVIGIKEVPLNTKEIKKFALKRNPFNHMSVAYKKSVIENVGGYQHHLYMEDYNLWLRVIAQGYEVGNLSNSLVKVRAGSQMYCRRKGIEYIKSEYILSKLKIELKLQSKISAYLYFLIRASSRLLPSKILGKLYKMLRK